jgi:hypothetical protein
MSSNTLAKAVSSGVEKAAVRIAVNSALARHVTREMTRGFIVRGLNPRLLFGKRSRSILIELHCRPLTGSIHCHAEDQRTATAMALPCQAATQPMTNGLVMRESILILDKLG